MIDIISIILSTIVALSILVTVHEYGHFWVARRCGVKVLRFSIGFGKSLFSWRDKKGTEFVLAVIPLGGYVKMLDEREVEVPPSQLKLAFNRKSVLQRIAIVLAGPLANFFLAIVAYWLVFTLGTQAVIPVVGEIDQSSIAVKSGLRQGDEIVAVDGEKTQSWRSIQIQLATRLGETGLIEIAVIDSTNDQERTVSIPIKHWLKDIKGPDPLNDLGIKPYSPEILPIIGDIIPGDPAAMAGLKAGDKIIAANNVSINRWIELHDFIQAHKEQDIELAIERTGEQLKLTIRPKIKRLPDGTEVGYIGVKSPAVSWPESMRREISYSLIDAWLPALQKTYSMSVFVLDSLKKMVTGDVSIKNLGGVVTIAKAAGGSAQAGLVYFIGMLALLSISLAILNLLPIPVLDGGHLLYYLIELVTRKPVSERVQVVGFQIGITLLIGVMLLALYNDLTGL